MATLIVAGALFPFTLHSDPPAPVTPSPKTVSAIPTLPPIFKHIAQCESQTRQFNADGTIHRGEINPKDIGMYQINEYWNGETARELGFDIYTLEGNTRMALWLYEHRGLQPWAWSKPCWGQFLPESG